MLGSGPIAAPGTGRGWTREGLYQNPRKFPIRFRRAAICCFPESELRNLNYLVLIPFCLVRAMRPCRFAKERSGNRRGGSE